VRRGAVAEIDLDAVTCNLGVVRRLTRNRPVIAVVKADAYGHGAIQVSRRLGEEGVSHLAVAFVEEGIKLREAGISTPIIVLFDRQDAALFFEYNLIPVLHDLRFAERLSKEGRRRGRVLGVHVKIDTGMGRLGFNCRDISRQINSVSKLGFVAVRGMMSHFSDSDVADKSFAQVQMDKFFEVKEKLLKAMKRPGDLLCHMANSAATMTLKEAHLDAVRPGIMLYGQSPLGGSGGGKRKAAFDLMPAMKVKTEVLAMRRLQKGTPVSYGRTFTTKRESLIAVLPVGYADGFSRAFSNNADVLIRGVRAPVVGRVCMDLTMVDVTDIEGVKEGDEVVLFGRQGRGEITARELADRAATIPYEILTSIGVRSRRFYISSGKPRRNQHRSYSQIRQKAAPATLD
jgi:alanine racemase